jgi:RHS repeat-associated protein
LLSTKGKYDANSQSDPIGFGGQWGYYTEYETGPGNSVAGSSLLLLTHRYYDPATGRFVNRDPIGYDGGINLYTFAGGNPVNNIDPDGTDDFAVISSLPVQKRVAPQLSWYERWHNYVASYMESPGWMMGMVQGQIDTQHQLDQTAAMRRMSEDERDANTVPPTIDNTYIVGAIVSGQQSVYASRIRQRGVQDPSAHNFPYSFDSHILATRPTQLPDGGLGYAMRGYHGDSESVFNMILKNGVVVHRDVINVSKWGQRSGKWNWPIDVNDIPGL